jgi:hypothetical protein
MDLLAFVQVASASVICLVAFALFGHQLDKRGEAAYARALGLIPQPATRQSSPTGDADRGSATRGDVGERAVA